MAVEELAKEKEREKEMKKIEDYDYYVFSELYSEGKSLYRFSSSLEILIERQTKDGAEELYVRKFFQAALDEAVKKGKVIFSSNNSPFLCLSEKDAIEGIKAAKEIGKP